MFEKEHWKNSSGIKSQQASSMSMTLLKHTWELIKANSATEYIYSGNIYSHIVYIWVFWETGVVFFSDKDAFNLYYCRLGSGKYV